MFKWIKNRFKKKEYDIEKVIDSMSKMSFETLGRLRELTMGFNHTPAYGKTDVDSVCGICGEFKQCVIIPTIRGDEKSTKLFICESCLEKSISDWYCLSQSGITRLASNLVLFSHPDIGSFCDPIEYLESKCVYCGGIDLKTKLGSSLPK